MMTEKQILLIKHSWSYVAAQTEDLAYSIAKKLSKHMPELRSQLKELTDNEQVQIMSALNHLVVSLPAFQKADQKIFHLLADHVDKGITREFYDAGLTSFLMTMEKKLGAAWTKDMYEAWIILFASVHLHLLSHFQLPPLLMRHANGKIKSSLYEY